MSSPRELHYKRPYLYPKQEAAIFCPERFAVIEAATKSGKTVGCLAWLVEQAIAGHEGWQYPWIAPWYGTARIAYRRAKLGLPATMYEKNEAELSLTLRHNGAQLIFRSAEKPDTLYGDDWRAAVLDEATRMRPEAWHAIYSTLTATRGPARLIGNVKGRKNFAFQLARKAEAGRSGWHYAKLTAQDAVEAGVLTQDTISEAEADLPASVFRELYYAEASDDGSNPFELGCPGAIKRAIRPLSGATPAAWGWDLGKSIDWTVGIGLDEAAVTAAFHRWQKIPWPETVAAITRVTGDVPALVDATGGSVGDPLLQVIQRHEMEAGGFRENFEGFKFTGASKQPLMEALAVAIQRGQIGYPDGTIVAELEAFEFEHTRTGTRYAAPEGMHDDCVCALALAWAMLGRRPAPMSIGVLGRGEGPRRVVMTR